MLSPGQSVSAQTSEIAKIVLSLAVPWMPTFSSYFKFLMLPHPLRLLSDQLSWPLRCSASMQLAPRELAQSFLPAPFLGLPRDVHRRGAPALDPTEATPSCRRLLISGPPRRPQPRISWAGAFPGAPPPWSPLEASSPVGIPHSERPRCLALAATALLLPPHV